MLRERTELYGVGDFDTHITAVQYNTIQYNSRTARKRTALAAAHASPRPVSRVSPMGGRTTHIHAD